MFQHGFPGLPHAMQQQMPHRTPNMQDNIHLPFYLVLYSRYYKKKSNLPMVIRFL